VSVENQFPMANEFLIRLEQWFSYAISGILVFCKKALDSVRETRHVVIFVTIVCSYNMCTRISYVAYLCHDVDLFVCASCHHLFNKMSIYSHISLSLQQFFLSHEIYSQACICPHYLFISCRIDLLTHICLIRCSFHITSIYPRNMSTLHVCIL